MSLTAYAAAATVLDGMIGMGGSALLEWACPVPYFGRLDQATAATVGINPSSREFVDGEGCELQGAERRLPTLRSLGLRDWSEADSGHLQAILASCDGYFDQRPYDRWFRVLDGLLAPLGATYYGRSPSACHVDLVPYATAEKWGVLSLEQRRRLLAAGRSAAGMFVRDSAIEVLVLNGQSVVREFETVSGARLRSEVVPGWSLPRSGPRHVPGVAYWGSADRIGEVDLGRRVRVVGYNHNLQSSFGVTAGVQRRIGDWVAATAGARP